VREIAVDFPEAESQHNVLSSLWARSRIDDLMGQDYNGMQQGAMKPELKETITNLGLEYRLMTQFTSFVAVEEMIVTDGGQPRRIDVPVEVPEGVNREDFDKLELHANLGYIVNTPVNGRYASVARLSAGTVNIVSKSGTNSTKSKSRRSAGGGAGGGMGSGSGGSSGVGGGGGGVANAPPAMASTVTVADAAEPLRVVSAEERQREQLRARLHPSILAVIDRLKNKGANAGADEAKFIRNGKAEIQIWLTDKSAETLAKLKELGFEVVLDPKSARLVIGRLPIEKLAALAELKSIRYVAPQVLS
jgi:uncharacterized spore protein YtfJ